ncbi:hypothetical protein FHY35_003765 [Xanthomonas arboricola]|nr:hypothetical protein [Xanthomonas arboricola]
MHVRAAPVLPTRPCGFRFALQDDSVFADFDIDEKSQLYLVRISFDGYGCCHPGWRNMPVKMPRGDSQKLLRLTEVNDLTHPDVASILSSYFVACGEAIWVDALQNNGLI